MTFLARRLVLAACVALAAHAAGAQPAYPNKPIRLVVPLPAGGNVDAVARMLQPKLAEAFGQPVVVENVAGAAGRIGSAQVAHAAPDGYTMLMVYETVATDSILYRKSLTYDPLKDLRPVSQITRAPQIALSSMNIPATNIAELVSHARQPSAKVNFGSAGSGSSSHLATALFARTVGAPMAHIPYNGGAPLMAALVGGHVDLAFVTTTFALQASKTGKVRLLGLAGATRHRAFPELKTLNEQGVPNLEVYGIIGLMAPAGTPDAVVNRWTEVLRDIAKRPETQAWFTQFGVEALVSSPKEFGDYLRSENVRWAKIIQDERITAE